MSVIKTEKMNELKSEVKRELLIERLDLEDISVADITDDIDLFNDGLGLDSIEAFEIIVGLEEMYGVTFDNIPADEIRKKIINVESIASLIYDELFAGSKA